MYLFLGKLGVYVGLLLYLFGVLFLVSGTAEPDSFSLVLHEMQSINRSKRIPTDIYLSSEKDSVQLQVMLCAQLSILFSRTPLQVLS